MMKVVHLRLEKKGSIGQEEHNGTTTETINVPEAKPANKTPTKASHANNRLTPKHRVSASSTLAKLGEMTPYPTISQQCIRKERQGW
jgi:hypothetical protein